MTYRLKSGEASRFRPGEHYRSTPDASAVDEQNDLHYIRQNLDEILTKVSRLRTLSGGGQALRGLLTGAEQRRVGAADIPHSLDTEVEPAGHLSAGLAAVSPSTAA